VPKITLFFPKYFDDPCWAGTSFSLKAPDGDPGHGRASEWVLGRSQGCDLTIEAQSVSRRHCALAYSYAADKWFATDLSSKNGTRLNGELLPPGDPTPVQVGDKLHLGPNPIHLVENEYSTEDMVDATTIMGTAPLDHHTGVELAPPPTASPPPKTVADALYLGESWLIAPTTMAGMAYRLIVVGLAALVAVLIMGAT